MPEQVKTEWQDETIEDFLGGLILDTDSELLENNQFVRLDNAVLRDKKLQRDTGYPPFLGVVRGDPRRVFKHKLNNGVIHEVLVTNLTVYRNVNNQWRYVTDGTATTLSAPEAGGSTALDVTSIAGFNDNDFIGVILDNGLMHFSQVNGAPGGGVINIDDALPSAAASGNAVVKAVVLAGQEMKHVSGVSVPWNEWLVFTNGVDPVKRYDPTAGSVITVPGLPASGNTIAATVVLYDSSIILAGMIEGGTAFPFRYRYSAKGDGTNWTTLEAGFTDVLDQASQILQALILGPYMILYREGSIVRVNVSSSTFRRFDTNVTIADNGIFSNLGVISFTDRHLVWANDNFYWYSGGFGLDPIENPIKTKIFGPSAELDETNRGKSFAVLLEHTNEALFFYQPSGASGVNKALRMHLDYANKWSFRLFLENFSGFGERVAGGSVDWSQLIGDWIDQVGDWASYTTQGNIEHLLLCSATQDQVMDYDYLTPLDDGAVIPFVCETKDFANPTFLIRHDYLDIAIRGGPLTVEYSTDKGTSWNLLGVITAGSQTQRFRFFRQFTSRHFRYRFSANVNVFIIWASFRFKYEFEW